MIFKPELAAKVLSGEKSMTRRRISNTGTHPLVRYQFARWYKVQPGRGKLHVCHIFVTKVREAWLNDISVADAKREGFRDRREFFRYWGELHPDSMEDERVAVIKWIVLPAVKECCAKLVPRCPRRG